MKRHSILAIIIALILSLTNSCLQHLPLPNDSTVKEGQVVIYAQLPEFSVPKVSVSETSTALELNWEQGDYLTIVSGEKSEVYTLRSISGKTATFVGKPISGSSYDIILSQKGKDYLNRSYETQIQDATDDTRHLHFDSILKGVDSYENPSFTKEWAESHGGELLQSGCMLLYFKLPEDVGYIKSVSLTAPSYIFHKTNQPSGKLKTITLAVSEANLNEDKIFKAYIMTSINEISIKDGVSLTLRVRSNIGAWTKDFTPGACKILPGRRNIFQLNAQGWTLPTGDGTDSNPYILRTAEDLVGMSSKLTSTLQYFAMTQDIDMSDVSQWIEITNSTPIDFNGNDRTIRNFKCNSGQYRGFIRILNGKIHNTNFTNAEIDGSTGESLQACGIVCGYCGNKAASVSGHIENVFVQGTVKGAANGVGGVVGILGNGSLNKCGANVSVSNTADSGTGGLVGMDIGGSESKKVSITHCWTSGEVNGGMQRIGGIIGALHYRTKSTEAHSTNIFTISHCYSSATVNGGRNVGGIVGNIWECQSLSKVEKCIAWNPSITATATSGNVYSSGAIAGVSRNRQLLSDCYRRADMAFSCTYSDINFSITLKDQENIGPSPMPKLSYSGPTGGESEHGYIYPYHGKSADSGASISSVAKELSWDETIWDLSGDVPVIKIK